MSWLMKATIPGTHGMCACLQERARDRERDETRIQVFLFPSKSFKDYLYMRNVHERERERRRRSTYFNYGKTARRWKSWIFIFWSFFKYFFGVACLFWLPLLFSFFCHQVILIIHLVFRWTRELNSCLRTMAQTVSPKHSSLYQGASPYILIFKAKALLNFSGHWKNVCKL